MHSLRGSVGVGVGMGVIPMQKSDMRLVEVLSFEHLPYILSHCHGANPCDILLLLHKSGSHFVRYPSYHSCQELDGSGLLDVSETVTL